MDKIKAYQVMLDGQPASNPWCGIWLMEDSRLREITPKLLKRFSLAPVPFPPMTLAAQVSAYARGHYEKGGWDVVVEAMEDDSIADAVSDCIDLMQVLTNSSLSACVDVWADRQADARNSAF